MNDQVREKVDEVVDYLKNQNSYKMCLDLKEKMKNNEDISTRVEEIKRLQKLYVNNGFKDKNIKDNLDRIEDELLNIPLYSEYSRNLEEANNLLNYFKDEMNDYFTSVFKFD